MTVQEAEKTVKELGLELDLNVSKKKQENLNKEEAVIKKQTPSEGIKINQGSKVFVKW